MSTIYIKPMTWVGKTRFYLGTQASDPTRHHAFKLGGYFLVVDDIETARAVAEGEARDWSKRSGQVVNVVECEHYTGL